ncbi:hypothetical protein CSOJ01_08948 [Colletotrichum sojae]|uniref:Uncharacterized protein n=1 Tax=Colletotrichum sojae TaxID=2175907 RepID=A0A8H6J4E8_9PEZI|nr:hypothetical protein CSOJ01_08948 [Colletotrichum sojae]
MVARKKDGKQKVVVAIDMGSTAARIAVNYLSENHVRPLFNSKAQCTQDRLQYERGAINACVNISDTGPAWIGDNLCASSVQLPVKFVISHGKGVIDDDNPLVAELRRRDKDQKFQDRCMEGIYMFMGALAAEIQKLCGSRCRPLEIVEIGLSVPAHWSLDVEDRYRQIFRETIQRAAKSTKDVKVCFTSEIECIAHYVCREPTRTEDVLDGPGDKVDVSSSSEAKKKEDADSFAEDNHLWEASVSEYCTENTFSGDEKKPITPAVRNALMRQFKEQIMEMGSEEFEEMELRARAPKGHSSGEEFCISIAAQKAEELFRNALDRPLRMAKDEIGQLAHLSLRNPRSKTQVIVSGGSAKSKKVQKFLDAVCEENGVPLPSYIYENTGPAESFRVAEGAAIATANRMGLREFINRGAAFGLQMFYGGRENWEMTGPMLLAGEKNRWKEGWSHTFDASGTDRCRIICDPFWKCHTRDWRLSCNKTYDLIDLLVPEEGRWRYRLVCNEAVGQEESLWLQREKLKPGSEEIVASHNVELKLEIHRSSNCFLVKPDVDLDFQHCGLGLEADGKFVALTEEFEESLKQRIDRRRKKQQSRGPNPGDADYREKTPASSRTKRKRDPPTVEDLPETLQRIGGAKPQGHLREVLSSQVRRR